MKSAHKIFLAASSALILMGGCAYEGPSGKPLPPLDYQNMAPLYVSVGQVDIVNHFHPTPDSNRAAAAFPTRPEDAINHYAENRLKAKGYEGTLRFIIEDATVKHSVLQPDNSVMQWAGAGVQDRYDVSLRLSLQRIQAGGQPDADATVELTRFITVPKGASIAKRQTILRDFTAKMVSEVDGMVTTALTDRMHLTVEGGDAPPPPGVHEDNDGTVTAGPAVPSLPVPTVHPEALPPPW
jgi:hypothetical protein